MSTSTAWPDAKTANAVSEAADRVLAGMVERGEIPADGDAHEEFRLRVLLDLLELAYKMRQD